jgi:hypothetical protein
LQAGYANYFWRAIVTFCGKPVHEPLNPPLVHRICAALVVPVTEAFPVQRAPTPNELGPENVIVPVYCPSELLPLTTPFQSGIDDVQLPVIDVPDCVKVMVVARVWKFDDANVPDHEPDTLASDGLVGLPQATSIRTATAAVAARKRISSSCQNTHYCERPPWTRI